VTSSEPVPDAERAAGIITRGLAAIIDLPVVLLIMSALYGGLALVRLVGSFDGVLEGLPSRRARSESASTNMPRGCLRRILFVEVSWPRYGAQGRLDRCKITISGNNEQIR
jgi:hypothetical protein